MKQLNFLTASSLMFGAYWVLDHLLPELLPKIPSAVGEPIAFACVAIMTVGLAIRGWRLALHKIPRPWLPKQFWRVGVWLRHRPSLNVVSANPSIAFVGDVIGACGFTLTLQRNASRSLHDVTFEFERAELELSQSSSGQQRKWLFRPVETGGLLGQTINAQSSDFIILSFTAMNLPMTAPQSPDFGGDYEIEIRGVYAEMRSAQVLRGELSPVRWQWFRSFNSGVLTELQTSSFASSLQ